MSRLNLEDGMKRVKVKKSTTSIYDSTAEGEIGS
jgi:hypothetical protein